MLLLLLRLLLLLLLQLQPGTVAAKIVVFRLCRIAHEETRRVCGGVGIRIADCGASPPRNVHRRRPATSRHPGSNHNGGGSISHLVQRQHGIFSIAICN